MWLCSFVSPCHDLQCRIFPFTYRSVSSARNYILFVLRPPLSILHHRPRVYADLLRYHRKDKIQWECDNGGQIWSASAAANSTSGTIPSGFCGAGFSSLNAAFIISLLVGFSCAGNTTCASLQLDWYTDVVGENPCTLSPLPLIAMYES